jgi:hypothetical protein
MTELVQEQVIEPNIIAGHQIRQTNGGDVIFINTNFVGQKVIDIIVHAINEMSGGVGNTTYSHELYTIIFRADGIPRADKNEPNSWIFNPDGKAAICNLVDCIDLAYTHTMDEDKPDALYCNIDHVVWANILTGFCHEAHHALEFAANYDTLISSEDDQKVEELRADEFATQHIRHLAKTIDLEPVFEGELLRMLNNSWNEYSTLVNEDKNADDHTKEWLMIQTHMKQSGDSHFMPAPIDSGRDHVVLATFRESMCASSPDSGDSSWDTAITPIECGLNIPDPMVTAEDTPATPTAIPANTSNKLIVNGIPFDPTEFDGHDDEDYASEAPVTSVQGAIAAEYATGQAVAARVPAMGQPMVPGMQGVVQQVIPVAGAPVAPGGQVAIPQGEVVYSTQQIDPALFAFQQTIKSLYTRLADHIFGSCGYNPLAPQVFSQKDKIADMIPITADEAKIVVSMNHYNHLGQVIEGAPCDNWVSGMFIDTAGTLPGYVLTLKSYEGVLIHRKFVPQNPNKVSFKTKQPTKPALEAKAGHKILWVIDPLDEKNSSRVYDGEYQRADGYDWNAV